ncbi:MAG: glycerate kinase [Phycisphaera sp.]|nr:glycerate kinase [Phycisphaera sp.]
MKVICAPDKFKGSLSAPDVAKAMRRGVLLACPDAEVDLCPIADGGEGTVEALIAGSGGQRMTNPVTGPRGGQVHATWGLTPEGLAIIEMASASGLSLLKPDERDPTITTTLGTGELLQTALDAGATSVLMGIGGSATNDMGCGCAMALGVRFFNKNGSPITLPLTGGMLHNIARIDTTLLDPRIRHTPIRVACDVTNPLTGPNGAAHVYSPQKGATPEQTLMLDDGLRHVAGLVRGQIGVDVENLPGAGAAGGLGAGLVAFLGATLEPGIGLVLDALHFVSRAAAADLCLTGEGSLDEQTLSGKAIAGVVNHAGRCPVIALAGRMRLDEKQCQTLGLTAAHAIAPGQPPEVSIARAAEFIEQTTAKVVADFMRSGRIG